MSDLRSFPTRLRSVPIGRALAAALALITLHLAGPANAQEENLFVRVGLFGQVDTDGDGLPETPPPPIGAPFVMRLGNPTVLLAPKTVTDNGLVIDTAVGLLTGSGPIDDSSSVVRGAFGPVILGVVDDVAPLPPGGFAVGRMEILTEVPVVYTSTAGGFQGTDVEVAISGRAEGTITYFKPNPSIGTQRYEATFVAEDSDEFDVTGATFFGDGTRFGDAPFLGGTSFYSSGPAPEDSSWTVDGASFSLTLRQPVTPGATTATGTITYKQFYEVGLENFFGSGLLPVGGTIGYQATGLGDALVSIAVTTPNVEIAIAVPEPGTAASLWPGVATLLLLRARRTDSRPRAVSRTPPIA